jgi:hypothetical protein
MGRSRIHHRAHREGQANAKSVVPNFRRNTNPRKSTLIDISEDQWRLVFACFFCTFAKGKFGATENAKCSMQNEKSTPSMRITLNI